MLGPIIFGGNASVFRWCQPEKRAAKASFSRALLSLYWFAASFKTTWESKNDQQRVSFNQNFAWHRKQLGTIQKWFGPLSLKSVQPCFLSGAMRSAQVPHRNWVLAAGIWDLCEHFHLLDPCPNWCSQVLIKRPCERFESFSGASRQKSWKSPGIKKNGTYIWIEDPPKTCAVESPQSSLQCFWQVSWPYQTLPPRCFQGVQWNPWNESWG